MDWLKTAVESLQNAGEIRSSKRPYCSHIVIVSKKTALGESPKFPLCIDYGWLKEQTKKDAFHLPRIQDLLADLDKARFFSSLDLASG